MYNLIFAFVYDDHNNKTITTSYHSNVSGITSITASIINYLSSKLLFSNH